MKMATWNILAVIWIFSLLNLIQMSLGAANCTASETCNQCRADFRCSWCASSKKCVEGTVHGLGNPKLCEAKDVYREYCCNEAVDCNSCASLYGCSWCAESRMCLELATESKCEGRVKNSVYQCTTLNICSQYTACHECVKDSNCGWCEGSKKCLAGASVPLDTAEKCPSGWSLQCPEKCEPVFGVSDYCGVLPPKVCSAFGPLDGSSFNIVNHYFATVLHEQMINSTCLHATALPLDKQLYCNTKACSEDSDCKVPKKMCHSLCMDCFKSETICDEKVSEGIVSQPGEVSCSFTIEEKPNFGRSLKNTIGWNVILLSIWWNL